MTDVEPSELMKLPLLNASHQGLCYFGRLSGYHYVHEATQDPLIARLSAAIVAGWARYAEGVDDVGETIDVVDGRRDIVMAHAARRRDESLAFLRRRDLFSDLPRMPVSPPSSGGCWTR
ncbi:hypothetical protein AB0B66_30485 [Catellatospora sp. NPDC049111]|uniref:mannitol dehydrogenase family protein n=1 Tax=Catellatospora sp. NPDC049111 TaxID=3155271 RepID=UPI0033C7F3F0